MYLSALIQPTPSVSASFLRFSRLLTSPLFPPFARLPSRVRRSENAHKLSACSALSLFCTLPEERGWVSARTPVLQVAEKSPLLVGFLLYAYVCSGSPFSSVYTLRPTTRRGVRRRWWWKGKKERVRRGAVRSPLTFVCRFSFTNNPGKYGSYATLPSPLFYPLPRFMLFVQMPRVGRRQCFSLFRVCV